MGHKWYRYTTWPVDTQDKILRIHDKYEVELTHVVLGYKHGLYVSNYVGSVLWANLCRNLNFWSVNISSNVSNFSSLNIGSVCER